jgi:Restriction endonuclease
MFVYVLNKDARPLMLTNPRKARKLLKAGKAKVFKRTPFALQLLYGSSGYKQEITLGVDSGFKHMGLSAVTEQAEVFASEVLLREDMVELNSERRQYRRFRRYRKTRYRQPRFLNRQKPEGWLAPSIQHKLDSHLKAIDQVKRLLPITKIVVEVAAFDLQKIKDPDIEGVGYQQGVQAGFWNVREYVLHRDGHQCQMCKGKSKDAVLNVHHLVSRKTGGDRPDNLITLCGTCHHKHHQGEATLKIKPSAGCKAETFMSTVRWKLIDALPQRGDHVVHTYGYLTKQSRIHNGIPKSHVNDAFVIAGGNYQSRGSVHYQQRQVRKQNRKLFKGERSHLKNTAPRWIQGFQRFDKVHILRAECFIFGRRSTGYFDLRILDGTKVHACAKAKELCLLESAQTCLIEKKRVA